jgi:hypothetical protein
MTHHIFLAGIDILAHRLGRNIQVDTSAAKSFSLSDRPHLSSNLG